MKEKLSDSVNIQLQESPSGNQDLESRPHVANSCNEVALNDDGKFRDSDAGDGTTRGEQILRGVPLYLCLFSSLLCMFLTALDQLITATPITVIANRFDGFDKIMWISAAFMLAMGCLAQVWGKISIIFGRKWAMVAGIVIFEIGSLICSVSNSMDLLIGGRAVQGIGAACVQSLSAIICTEVVTIDKRPTVVAFFGIVFTVACVAGPIVGGAFTSYATWRWCFYINLIIGGVILPLFLYSFRPPAAKGSLKEKFKRLDYLGSILMIIGVVLPLLALSFGVSEANWGSSSVICCFIFGGICIFLFLIWNLKYSKEPLLLNSIARIPTMFSAVGSLMFGFSAFLVTGQFLVVYFQVIRGNTAIESGLALLPFFVPTCIFTVVAGVLLKVTGQIKLIGIISGIFLVIGYGLFLLIKESLSFSKRVGYLFFAGIGTGIVSQPAFMSVQILAPKEPGGLILSNALLSFGRNVGISLFSEIAQVIYTESLKTNLQAIQDKVETTDSLLVLVTDTSLIENLSKADKIIVKHAVMKSIKNIFYFGLVLAIFSLICSLFMSNKKLPKKEDVEHS